MSAFTKLLKDILTGIDQETYDSGRVLCLCSFLIYFIIAIATTAMGKPWSPIDFSAGIGTMAVGFGINLHMKRLTEPQPKGD